MASKRGRSNNRIVKNDLSDGKELHPISVINNYNDEVPLFNYINRNMITDGVDQELLEETGSPPIAHGCTCEGPCDEHCECENKSLVVFDPDYRIVVNPMQYDFYNQFYVECGLHCECKAKCKRRIFPGSHSLKKLHVEFFANKGYGVVVDQPVAVGMPICEYRGLVCLQEKDLIRSSHYQEDLLIDNKGFFYVVDAVHNGSVARLINHSCSPNLVQINVFSSIPSPRKIPPLPRVALVACRDILPGTELTFSYGPEYFLDRNLRCFCYESCCLIPPDDWARYAKSRAKTRNEIAYAKRYIEKHFEETADVDQKIIELD